MTTVRRFIRPPRDFADDDADELARDFKRTTRNAHRRTEADAMKWKLHKAFVGRSTLSFCGGHEVRIQFASCLEAEEFHKLMMSARGK